MTPLTPDSLKKVLFTADFYLDGEGFTRSQGSNEPLDLVMLKETSGAAGGYEYTLYDLYDQSSGAILDLLGAATMDVRTSRIVAFCKAYNDHREK